MALARVKVWNAGDLLKAADLNGEFNNILNNPISLVSPTTGIIVFTSSQTFPVPQLISTKTDAGAAVSLTTAGLHTEGTVVIPGTAPLQFNSSVQLQLGLGVIPLKTTSGNWVQRAVTVPITISATSTTGSGALVQNQTNYVYAFDSLGVTNLEFRTTAGMPHSPSTENGTEVATTDATRTLVGMVRVNNSTQFSDDNSLRFVQTWYTRPAKPGTVIYSTTRSVVTTSFSEVSTDGRFQFVSWTSQTVQAGFNGTVSAQGPGTQLSLSLVFDSSNTNDASNTVIVPAFAGATITVPVSISNVRSGLSEGFHFVTLNGLTITTSAGSTGTIFSRQASAGDVATVSAIIV